MNKKWLIALVISISYFGFLWLVVSEELEAQAQINERLCYTQIKVFVTNWDSSAVFQANEFLKTHDIIDFEYDRFGTDALTVQYYVCN